MDIKEKYDWSGVYMDWNERYGWHLTKERVIHSSLQQQTQQDSTPNDEPTPSLKDTNPAV